MREGERQRVRLCVEDLKNIIKRPVSDEVSSATQSLFSTVHDALAVIIVPPNAILPRNSAESMAGAPHSSFVYAIFIVLVQVIGVVGSITRTRIFIFFLDLTLV